MKKYKKKGKAPKETEAVDVTAIPSENQSETVEAPTETVEASAETLTASAETIISAAADEDLSSPDGDNTSTEDGDTSTEDGEASIEDGDISSEETDQAVENKVKKKKAANKNGETSPVRLIVTLASVCLAIAVLLGGVNLITRSRIAKAAEAEKTSAILAVFSEGDSSRLVKTTDTGDEIHLVFKGDGILGYCVFTTASGFGGDIKMIVGIDTEYNTKGVKIISMSETPGVGTKTNTLGFLDRFIGGTHTAPVDKVEAIAGATISSEAIKSAVAAAHKLPFDLKAAADEAGAELITDVTGETNKETDAGTEGTEESSTPSESETDTASSESDSDVPTDPTDSENTDEPTEETSDIPFVENGGGHGYYVYEVGTGTSHDHYVIEVTKETDEAGEIVLRLPETSESTTTAEPVTEPESSETTDSASLPIVTTSPETESSPMGSATTPSSEPSSETSSEAESSEETPTEPIPTTPEDTTPISPDTSDPNGEEEPVVRPGVSIGGSVVGGN